MLGDLEQRILDVVQDGFPLTERPYKALAQLLAVTEESAFAAVEQLRSAGIIRRIGGVFDSRKLGYTSRLCCGIVPAGESADGEAMEQFAAAVLKVPAITHNYIRSHGFNVWFTVIGKSEEDVRDVVRNLEKSTVLYDTHILNAKKMFKINTVMKKRSSSGASSEPACACRAAAGECERLAEFDLACVKALAGDLPHSQTPFADWISGVSSESLLASIGRHLGNKTMRRFGAILRHQQAGFAENAMTCFKVDPEFVAEAGEKLSAEDFVSHCYEREAFEEFSYNVYAMVHGTSADDLQAKIGALVEKLGSPEYAVLRSVRELKKTSFKFDC